MTAAEESGLPSVCPSPPSEARSAGQAGALKPGVEERLHAAGLSVEYFRGQGDYLYYKKPDGEVVEVLDLVGGYGACLFGHNHPRLVKRLQEVLTAQRPCHAQGSDRAYANALSTQLAGVVRGETGRDYVVVLESTGAGAVEAAIKHAELEFRSAQKHRHAQWTHVQKQLRIAQRGGEVTVVLDAAETPYAGLDNPDSLTAEAVMAVALECLKQVEEAPPVVIALEGGFHGKSTGALSLTANPRYRAPWQRLGLSTHFIPQGDVTHLDAVLSAARRRCLELSFEGNTLKAKATDVSNVLAAFVEPIQGEGGVVEIDESFLAALASRAKTGGFPLVMDEIQSGMGRTGRFLAGSCVAESFDVVPDYVLLSKALGGGLCKVSALLVHEARYERDFGLLHTATFADDDLSSAVALEGLRLLQEDGGALMHQCAVRGAALLTRLQSLKAAHPGAVRSVRGRGLMVGLELYPRVDSSSAFLREASRSGLLGYLLSAYLLREHRVRVAPTLSNPNTLRIQPSAYVCDADVQRFCDSLAQALELLESDDTGAILGHLVGRPQNDGPRTKAGSTVERRARPTPKRRVSFIAHPLEPQALRGLDASFAEYSPDDCEGLLGRLSPLLEQPLWVHRDSVRGAAGTEVGVSVIAVPFTSSQIMAAFRRGEGGRIRDAVLLATELAKADGAEVIGFGGYTSIATNSCLDIVEDQALITSGNSVTAAAAIHATLGHVFRSRFRRRRLGIVGAAGNLGSVIAEVMAPSMNSVVLTGRPGAERRLERRARNIRQALGARSPSIEIATDLSALATCDVIMSATNAPAPVLGPEHIGSHPTVICDIAAPGDVMPGLSETRRNATVLKGGVVQLPGGQSLDVPGMEQPPGHIFGCLAETLLLGLERAEKSPSVGPLTPEGIFFAAKIADRHGFIFAPRDEASEPVGGSAGRRAD